MTTVLLLTMMMSSSTAASQVWSDLQAMYDEVDQATLQFSTPKDVDSYYSLRYTPDWTFVDAKGQHHSWSEVRASIVAGLTDRDDWLRDSIQKVVSVKPDGAVVLVSETVVKKPASDKQTTSEVTSYKDSWVRVDGEWKLQTREQVGATKNVPYRPYSH